MVIRRYARSRSDITKILTDIFQSRLGMQLNTADANAVIETIAGNLCRCSGGIFCPCDESNAGSETQAPQATATENGGKRSKKKDISLPLRRTTITELRQSWGKASEAFRKAEELQQVSILRENQSRLQTVVTIADVDMWLRDHNIKPLQRYIVKQKVYEYKKDANGKYVKERDPRTGKLVKVKELDENGNPKFHYEDKIKLESPTKRMQELLKNEAFTQLNIFDRARIAAQFERGDRVRDYSGKFSIQHAGTNNMKMADAIKIGDKEFRIIGADTIQGCDQMCLECYAAKMAAISGITHQHPILAKLGGTLRSNEILRVGTNGEPGKDWNHTNEQIRDMIKRSQKAGNDVSVEKNIFFITKLLNIDGFDPEIEKNLEVSMDPIYPEHMRQTMTNILRIKSKYPDTNIVLRIRSVNSNDPAIMAIQDDAIKFANTLGLPVLETKMRFVRETSAKILDLNMDPNKPPYYSRHITKVPKLDKEGNPIIKNGKYVYQKENQLKLTHPGGYQYENMTKSKAEVVRVCNEKNEGTGACAACHACYDLMIGPDREKNIARSKEKMSKLNIDISKLGAPTRFDPTGYGVTQYPKGKAFDKKPKSRSKKKQQ